MYCFILLFKEKKHEKSQTISAVYFLLFIFIFQIFFPDFSRAWYFEDDRFRKNLLGSYFTKNSISAKSTKHISRKNTFMVVLIQNHLGFYILETCTSYTLKKRKCCVAVQTLAHTLENLITYFSSPYGLSGMWTKRLLKTGNVVIY